MAKLGAAGAAADAGEPPGLQSAVEPGRRNTGEAPGDAGSACVNIMCLCVYDGYVCVSVQEPLLFKENSARLSGAARFFNASFQVAACTAVGCGPWSPPVLVLPPAGRFQSLRIPPAPTTAPLLHWAQHCGLTGCSCPSCCCGSQPQCRPSGAIYG